METQKNNDRITYMCMTCKSEKMCTNCMIGYKSEDNFCIKCGEKLSSLESFEGKPCPICSKTTRVSGPIFKVKIGHIKISGMFDKNETHFSGGVIIEEECECGNYEPTSTSGVIDDSCRNCGGKPREIILG